MHLVACRVVEITFPEDHQAVEILWLHQQDFQLQVDLPADKQLLLLLRRRRVESTR